MKELKIVTVKTRYGSKICIWKDTPINVAKDEYRTDGEVTTLDGVDVVTVKNPEYRTSYWPQTDVPETWKHRYEVHPVNWVTEWEMMKARFRQSNHCIVGRFEHPNHTVACCKNGVKVNKNGEVVCEAHKLKRNISDTWRGKVRGA